MHMSPWAQLLESTKGLLIIVANDKNITCKFCYLRRLYLKWLELTIHYGLLCGNAWEVEHYEQAGNLNPIVPIHHVKEAPG